MDFIRHFLMGVMLLFAAASAQSEIYQWTDSSGNVHFSDEPRPGAKPADLPPPQTFSSPPVTESSNQNIPKDFAGNEQSAVSYDVQITQPKPQATIRNNEGFAPVVVQVSPELNEGDKIQIMFDGHPLGEPSLSTTFTLREVVRGSHTVSAVVVSSQGKEITQSESVTFYMHRPRVGMVPETKRAR